MDIFIYFLKKRGQQLLAFSPPRAAHLFNYPPSHICPAFLMVPSKKFKTPLVPTSLKFKFTNSSKTNCQVNQLPILSIFSYN